MRRLKTFLTLPRTRRKVLVKTLILLWLVRIGLWLLSYDKLCQLLSRNQHRLAGFIHEVSVEQVARDVRTMSHYVLAATCLAKALVTTGLLEHAGQPASLRIGVARSPFGTLEAHAWVEIDGRIIIGGSHADISRYIVLRPV